MPDIAIKDQLKKLIELQAIDIEIYNLKQELKEKPAALEELKQEFENSKAYLKELEEKLKQIQVGRSTLEGDLKQKEDQIAKSNADLSSIKTNKEYTAKIKEIENYKTDKSIIEEKILKSYDEADAVNVDVTKEKEKVAGEEKNYLAKKNEVESQVKIVEDRIKVLQGQRGHLIPDVEAGLLARYERTLEHKEGRAIVPVTRNSCGGCYMNVPAQEINRIKMNQEIVQCEFCTRILYIEEDM